MLASKNQHEYLCRHSQGGGAVRRGERHREDALHRVRRRDRQARHPRLRGVRPPGAGRRHLHGVRQAQGHSRPRGGPGGHSAGALYRDRQRAVQVHHLYRRKDHGQHHLRCLLPGDHHQPGRHAGQQVLLHPAGGPPLPEGISTITI